MNSDLPSTEDAHLRNAATWGNQLTNDLLTNSYALLLYNWRVNTNEQIVSLSTSLGLPFLRSRISVGISPKHHSISLTASMPMSQRDSISSRTFLLLQVFCEVKDCRQCILTQSDRWCLNTKTVCCEMFWANAISVAWKPFVSFHLNKPNQVYQVEIYNITHDTAVG